METDWNISVNPDRFKAWPVGDDVDASFIRKEVKDFLQGLMVRLDAFEHFAKSWMRWGTFGGVNIEDTRWGREPAKRDDDGEQADRSTRQQEM